MSAGILRQLVANKFGIDPRHVKLSGDIDPGTVFNSWSCWSPQSDTWRTEIWAFSCTKGFVQLKVLEQGNNTKGETYGDSSCPTLAEQLVDIEQPLFIYEDYRFSSGNGIDHDKISYTLYKCPDFKAYLKGIEDKDIKRWREWLK